MQVRLHVKYLLFNELFVGMLLSIHFVVMQGGFDEDVFERPLMFQPGPAPFRFQPDTPTDRGNSWLGDGAQRGGGWVVETMVTIVALVLITIDNRRC